MSDVIGTVEHEGLTASIMHDTDAASPLEFLTTHVITPHHPGTRRYKVDDRTHDMQWVHDALFERGVGQQFDRFLRIFCPEYVALPCFMYDHGDVALSASSFVGRAQHASWDSSMIGWAIVPTEIDGWKLEPQRVIDQDLETLTNWMNGETYGFEIVAEDGEELANCWGFYGLDDVEAYVKHEMEALAAMRPKQLTAINENGEINE